MKRFDWQRWTLLALTAWAWAMQPKAVASGVDWATYLGGNADDYGMAVAVDGSGNVLVCGTTFSEGWTSGGFNTNYSTSRDAFVAKFSPTGTLLWSTYIGGASDDQATGIAVDPAGNVYVVGHTRSRGWTTGGFDTSYNDNSKQDAFVAKLSPSGTHLWSTLLGGSEWEYAWGVAVDSFGNVLVTGSSTSGGWTKGGANVRNSGGQDAYVVKISPAGTHLWSTFIGGYGLESGRSIAVDSADNVLVTGETISARWVRGVAGTNFFGTNFNGGQDVFVAKLSPAGSNLWSTYLGGKYVEQSTGIAVDGADNILVTGLTTSSNWIRGGFRTNYNYGQDGFVAKLNPAGNHLWSTYFGGVGDDFGAGLAVDRASGNVFVTGSTRSGLWATNALNINLNGVPSSGTNLSSDAFVLKLAADGSSVWSGYLGGESPDGGRGIALDGAGNLFVAGWTLSTNWNIGGFSTTNNGGVDAFVAKVSDTGPSACPLGVLATPLPMLPVCGSTISNFGPTLAWTEVGNESGYVVMIVAGTNLSGLTNFISLLIPAGTNFLEVPPWAKLQDRQTYTWAVQAKGDGFNYCDSAWSGGCSFTLRMTDRTPPSVAITNPVANARLTNTVVTNSVLTIGGRAADNVAVARVLWELQYGVPLPVPTTPNSGYYYAALGTTNWQDTVTLEPGTNTLTVFSEDTAGNFSAPARTTFTYVVPSTLTVITNGRGTIARYFTTNLLEVGHGYTAIATPAAGCWFSNWTATVMGTNGPVTTVLTNNPYLNFIMQTGLVLQANFVTNQFIGLRGTYSGLFYPTNAAQTVANSGFFTLALSDRGAFSGRLLLDGETLPFSGGFDLAGQARMWVNWSTVQPVHFGMEPLALTLNLIPGMKAIEGSVRYNAWWNAPLESDLAVPTNAFAGSYTLVMDGSSDAALSPAGFGAATAVMDARANVSVSGTLADGTPISQATTISAVRSGVPLWPLYVPLYRGKGVLLGWMGTNATTMPLWVKPPVANDRYYSNGFSMVSTTIVARYTPPKGSTNALNWTNGLAIIGGGNLPGPFTNRVVLTNNQLKVVSGSISNLTLSLSAANGSFNGSFRHPSTRAITPVRGALVQDPTAIHPLESGGWFLGTNQGGFLRLEPQL